MRVLHFYRTYLPETVGGIEQVIYQLCFGSDHSGVQSEVLTLCRNPAPTPIQLDGHRVHQVRANFRISSTDFSYSAIQRFKQLAAQAEIIHYHFPWPFMDMVHFWCKLNKPSVVSYHSDIVRQRALLHLYKPLMYRFLDSVTEIVAASPNYLESSPILKHFRRKVRVIPYGLNKQSYPAVDPLLLDKWRGSVGDKFFLFVGVMRYYKGLHILLEAAKDLPYPVVIVGAGPMEQALKARAAELQLDNVHFLGRIGEEDKVALLTLCTAIVFPSHLRSEAFGVSLLEGAMYGKPLISSEIGTGTSYINIDKETGLVVPPSDPQALRNAMQTLWENPPLAKTLGLNAKARYEKLFTAEQMRSGYARLYREILGFRTTP